MDKSDNQLIEEFLSGEQKNLEILIDRYLKIIFNYVQKTTGDSSETEDIVQEVFVKVWKNINKFNLNQNFKTWIFTIARNTTIDWLRKKKSILFSELKSIDDEGDEKSFEENIADLGPLPNEIFERKELTSELEKMLSKIKPAFKEIIILRYKEDMTFQEISEVTGKPLNTVKSQCRRALQQLRNIMVEKRI